jgi:hypothetical protein
MCHSYCLSLFSVQIIPVTLDCKHQRLLYGTQTQNISPILYDVDVKDPVKEL